MKRLNIFICVSLIFSFFLLFGCGGGDSGSSTNINLPTQGNVTLCGYINEGSLNHNKTASELRYSLGGNLSGITVFIENNRNLQGITDESGKFVIENVPEGFHSLIAEKQEADKITYRQRLYNINIKGIYNYFELPEPIAIIPSPYSLSLTITNINNKPINNAKVSIWGSDYNSDANGLVTLNDFPNLSDEDAVISATGYKTTKIKLSFGETLNSNIFVKLSQTSENNIAPIVEINHDNNSFIIKENNKLYISANRQVLLTALGYDPDGDSNKISWNWSADKGSFSGLITANTVTYTSPSTSGEAIITLIGKDEKGLEGKAELKLVVRNGNNTETSTNTQTSTNTNTSTDTRTNTSTSTNTQTNTQTDTNTSTGTNTSTNTNTNTTTNTNTLTDSQTQTDTNTQTTTETTTSTNTQSATNTETNTQTNTQTNTDTDTNTENIATFTVVIPKKTTDKLVINFDKPLITSDFLNYVGFLPIATQTWSFSNNNKTASFIPEKGSWYPGSYNLLVINKDLKFNDGSILEDDYVQAFTLNSDIPVPEGYQSYAFPMTFKANEAGGCGIPFLKEGKNAYALIMNYDAPIKDGNIIGASVGYKNTKDSTYQYRLQELELQNKKLPDIVLNGKTSASRSSLKNHQLYEQKRFYVNNTDYPIIQCVLVAFNDKVLVYADANIPAKTVEEVEARANIIINEFSKNNGILQTNEQFLGRHRNVGQMAKSVCLLFYLIQKQVVIIVVILRQEIYIIMMKMIQI